MYKKLFVGILAAGLAFGARAITATDASGVEWEYAEIGVDKARVEKLMSIPPELGGHVDVPVNIVAGRTVTSVNAGAFKDCTTLEDVWFPSCLESFGEGVFEGCTSLENVTITGLAVSSLPERMFKNCTALKGVEIPDSVKVIESQAFLNCTSLESLVIPDGVTEIGSGAFSGCTALSSVTLPDGLTSIGANAFLGAGLKTVYVNEGHAASVESLLESSGLDMSGVTVKEISVVTTWTDTSTSPTITWSYRTIGDDAEIFNDGMAAIDPSDFYGPVAIPSEIDGHTVVSIGASAFSGCDKITGVTIPATVTSIGDSAFAECDGMESVAIPGNVTTIGSSAFYGCDILNTVTIAEGVKKIRGSAFYNCLALTSVAIPSSVREIGNSAFYGCAALKSAVIPDGVERIESSVFYGCGSLESVEIGEGVKKIGGSAFYGCTSLKSITIPDGVTRIDGQTFYECDALEEIAIPDGVTRIGDSAFYGCDVLKSVDIPNSVEFVGASAFDDCAAIESLTVPQCLCNDADSVATAFPYALATVTELKFADGVTSVAYNACKGFTAVKKVTIPAELGGSISLSSAFPDAYGVVTDVTLCDGMTSIAAYAFSGCYSLASIKIPDSVTKLGVEAFGACNFALYDTTTIPNVTLVDGWAIDSDMFSIAGDVDLTGVHGIGGSAFTGRGEITSVKIPSTAKGVGDSAFSNCSKLANVTIAEGVTSIGNYAFSNCANLTSVSIPDSVTEFGDLPFSYCNDALYDMTTIPGVTLVDEWAIDSDAMISGVVNLTGVRGIIPGAFINRDKMTGVTFSDSLVSICSAAFFDCDLLSDVTIPDSVTHIGMETFRGCDQLAKATLPIAIKPAIDADPSIFQDCHAFFEIVYHAIFTVTFDANGGTVSETSRMVDSSAPEVGELPTPTLYGYDFVDWYTAATGGDLVSPTTKVTADVTYYAHWQPKTVTITFDANGGEGGFSSSKKFGEALAAPTVTRVGHTFVGWSPEVPPSVPAGNATYVAQWTANVLTVSLLLNAEDASLAEAEMKVNYGDEIGVIPSPTRLGYTFIGWFTASEGGDQVEPTVKVTVDMEIYAHWTENAGGGSGSGEGGSSGEGEGGGSGEGSGSGDSGEGGSGSGDSESSGGEGEGGGSGDPIGPCYEKLEMGDITEPYSAPSAVILHGAVYDGCDVVGIVELKLGKENVKKGTSKISGSVTLLNGKKYSIKAQAAPVDGISPAVGYLPVKSLGTMHVAIGGAKFAGSLGDWHVQSASVCTAWSGKSATASVEIDDVSAFSGMVLTGLLPYSEVADVNNGKWQFKKAAGVKWGKPKKGAALPEINDPESGKGLIVDTAKDKTNLSGLKLAYTPKKGTFKGSFKVYELQGQGAKTKLKKYTVKVSGVVVGGVGHGVAICKNPAAIWNVTVE